MQHIIKIILLLLTVKVLNAQQIAMYSHYFYKPMVYNPAYTGTDDAPNAMFINHTQWAGFKGAPQYNILTFDGNFKNKNTGLGVVIISDRKGLTSRIGGNLNYSYKLVVNTKTHLLFGISAGVINQKIDFSNAITETSNDPSLFANTQQKTTFDANAGLAFVWDKFEFGFSIPQLANNKIAYISNTDVRTYYTQARHYMGTAKYKFIVSKAKDISITPLALVRYIPQTPFQFDANINLDWKNKFWIGATYKSNYAIGAVAGVTLYNRLSIGYSYDFITGNIGKYSGISHEIMLNFKFIKKKKEIIDTSSVAQEDDADFKAYFTSRDLNKLIIQQLIKKIEILLDKGNATPTEINALQEEIASFLDTESSDKNTQKLLKEYYNTLNQSKEELTALIKGVILFDTKNVNKGYENIIIKVTDLETKTITAICKPNSKTGTYFIILKLGKKYLITAEKEGYQTYSKEFTTKLNFTSYEINQEIRLKQ